MKQAEDLLHKIKLYSKLMIESTNAGVQDGLLLRKEADEILSSIEKDLNENFYSVV